MRARRTAASRRVAPAPSEVGPGPARFLLASTILAGLLFAWEPLAAECASARPGPPYGGGAIGILADPGIEAEAVRQAVELWRACPGYGADFPGFVVGGMGSRTLRVENGGRNVNSQTCGSFLGETVTLYRFATNPNGRRVFCGPLALNLAHELGHVLGLRHPSSDLACSGDIMARINGINAKGREVSPEECRAVGAKWLTPVERDGLAGAKGR